MALDRLDTAKVPMWAAWWLVQGHDSEALRNLAGLSGSDGYEVRDALVEALADLHIDVPSVAPACRVVFDAAARECLAGQRDELSIVRLVDGVFVTAGY